MFNSDVPDENRLPNPFVAGSLVRVGRLLGLRRYGFLLWGFLLRYLLHLTGRFFLSRSFHVLVTALAW